MLRFLDFVSKTVFVKCAPFVTDLVLHIQTKWMKIEQKKNDSGIITEI